MADPMHITQNNLGFDIKSVINQLVQAKAQPIERLQENNSGLQEKIGAWNEVDTKISDLRSKLDTVTGFDMWDKSKAEVTLSSKDDLMSATAGANPAEGTYDFEVSQMAESHKVASASAADITGITDADASTDLGLEGAFTLGGETISVVTSDSLNDLKDTINGAASNMSDSERVEANIVDNRLVIKREQTGSTNISISESPDNGGADEPILDSGGLDIWDSTNGFHYETQAAQDLKFTVDGMSVTRSSNTEITDVIEGVTLNLNKTGTATLEVGPDVASMKTNIQDFIDAYNSAMSEAENKSDVTINEDSVDTSTLHGSSLLRRFQANSRDTVLSSDGDLNSDFDSLRKIGIYTTNESNRLEITDSEKLENALKNNRDQVEALFRDSDDGGVKKFSNYVDSIVGAGGSIDDRLEVLNDRIDNNDDKIEDHRRRIEGYEQQLWRQYSRLDQMAGEMQQMSSYVQRMIG